MKNKTKKEDIINNNSPSIVKRKYNRKPKNDILSNNTILSENDTPSLPESIGLQISNDNNEKSDSNSELLLESKSMEIEIEIEKVENTKIEVSEIETLEVAVTEPVQGKKRGRKPKGGKITQQVVVSTTAKESKPNIILHLKCFMKDLQLQNQNNGTTNIESYHF
jgi:hypothetical protein